MRSFVLIAASLASLCAAAALPLDPLSSLPLSGATNVLGGLTSGTSGLKRDGLTSPVDEILSKAGGLRARNEGHEDIPDLFVDLDTDITAYITALTNFGDSSEPGEVISVLGKLKVAVDTYLPALRGLEGKAETVVFTTASGEVVTITDVAVKIASPFNTIIAAAHHIISLDIIASVRVDLVAAVEAIVGVVEETVVVVPALATYINADVVDTYHVVAELGITVRGGLVL